MSDAVERSSEDEEIKRRVIERLDELNVEGKRKVLDFSERLSSRGESQGQRDTRAALLRYAGTIPKEDLDRISEAIEEGCEKVDEEGVVAAPGANQPRGFLLDTNVVVAVFKQEEPLLAKLEDAEAGALFVPVITLGELRFGALKSVRVEENLRRIEGFAAESNVLPCDEDTARLYGKIKDDLRRTGRPIPENDIWIAAIALRHELALVTRDSHSEHVAGLQIEHW